ncbi:unnamed protein product [Gulo gulo]|uniref:Uncharacterized protein n=1 Tax=Gulo gulo TaxID=48420 RepID=A0A9X9LKB9_GULGU|nr:unnamed protein product [Gulo gulo]
MLAVGAMEGTRQSAFLLSSPPLAALHSMAEMKTPLYPAAYPPLPAGPPSSSSSSSSSSSPSPPLGAHNPGSLKPPTAGGLSSLGSPPQQLSAATPHGINDILSRPSMPVASGAALPSASPSGSSSAAGWPAPLQQPESAAAAAWALLQPQRSGRGRGRSVPQAAGRAARPDAHFLARSYAEPTLEGRPPGLHPS